MRTLLAAAAIAAVVIGPSGRASNGTSPDDLVRHRSASDDAPVTIRTFQFTPDTMRVRAGTRVVWTNSDEIEHTITSGAPDTKDNRFHGVVATRGATYSAVLQEPGTYRYFCDRHRFMNGTVIVSR